MLLYVAACLLVILALAHSWLGERYLLRRLFRRSEQLPKLLGSTAFTKNTLRFTWHLTTILACGVALLLAQIAAQVSAREMAATLGAMLILSSLLPLLFTRGRHLSWVGLFAAGALCLAWAAA